MGPRAEVMERLGDKVKAKEVALEIGVPLIPDSQVSLTTLKDATNEAARIGYPIMLKAAAGGGGRGMRVLRDEEQMGQAFFEARNEARNAFGDDTVFLGMNTETSSTSLKGTALSKGAFKKSWKSPPLLYPMIPAKKFMNMPSSWPSM